MEFKSSGDVLDFVEDYTNELGTDTISSYTWTLDSGITLDSSSQSGLLLTAWVSGGTTGMTYKVLLRVVSAAGRIFNKEWYLRIQDQRAG